MPNRLTSTQKEILTLMAKGADGDGDIMEDYDHPGCIYLSHVEPYRYVDWRTVRILEREGLIFNASTPQERYCWKITEAGRMRVLRVKHFKGGALHIA